MKAKHALLFILLSVFWAGMMGGISFLEAPVKFMASSLTLSVGLDVGRHVFGMLNKVELVLGTLLLVLLILARPNRKIMVVSLLVLVSLLLESFWLLPVLDERALVIIAGGMPNGDSPHTWYVMFECVKLACLLMIGIIAFKEQKASIAIKA